MKKNFAADWDYKISRIPKKAEMVQKIKAKGIRLSSEIEFAEFTNAKIIAITGSNGKPPLHRSFITF